MKTLGSVFLIPCLTFTSFVQGQEEAGTYSLVISEIMADPYPGVALPEAEYLEIFNRGSSPVSLAGYRLHFGDKVRILGTHPDGVVQPGEFIILCDEKDEPSFNSMGKTLPITNMPAIVNTGATLVLEAPSGKVIHAVSFTDRWYRNHDKAEGGWSLEMIDTDNPCGHDENWCESADAAGGTPGHINSVNAENPDCRKPVLLRASVNSDSSVILYFSEEMDSVSLMDPMNYYCTQGLLYPEKADPVWPSFSTVKLSFEADLNSALTYSVTVLTMMHDCAGNSLQNSAGVDFAIPVMADSFDIVINEILFDTQPGISEFIELFNRSDKVIDLAGFSIASCNVNTDSVIRMTSLGKTSFLLFPGRYVAITRRAGWLPVYNKPLDLGNVVELPSLFSFPDKEGRIAILTAENQITDLLYYNSLMHSIFLKEKEGISLERINADMPTNDLGNWYSAAFDKGYSTPGFKNSQEISVPAGNENISVTPPVFSPDGDGTDDQTFLTIMPGGSGYIGNIAIYDSEGRMIKTMGSNMLLGSETILSWDGNDNDGKLVPLGIYLIYIEIFNQQGEIKKYRKVVTLARRLYD